jgi:hypothetical protein
LEEEKTEETRDASGLNGKLKEVEEELIRVHNLEASYHAEERIVYINFEETINSFCDISHMLQSPLIEHQSVSRCILTDEATTSSDTEPSSVHGKTRKILRWMKLQGSHMWMDVLIVQIHQSQVSSMTIVSHLVATMRLKQKSILM